MRVPVEDSTNQVLVILVDPPQMGQPPFICRANGEGLQSGRIYYLGDGDTREPTADELDLLMARGAARPSAPVELDVAIVGTAVPLIVDERTVDDIVTNVRRRLLAAIPRPEPQPSPATGFAMGASDGFRAAMGVSSSLSRMLADQASAANRLAALTVTEEPEKRSEDEYRAEIDAWEERFRAAWSEAVELFAVHALPANEVTVVNKTRTFLHDVEVKLHLDGAVEAADRQGYGDGPEWRDLQLPRPPRKWGPTKRDLGLHGYPASLAASLVSPSAYVPRPYLPPDASWRTTGSVDVDIVVGDLRPEATFQTDDGDAVLLIRGETPEQVQGTWTATARGYNEVFTGEVEVQIAEPTHLTGLIREFFDLD